MGGLRRILKFVKEFAVMLFIVLVIVGVITDGRKYFWVSLIAATALMLPKFPELFREPRNPAAGEVGAQSEAGEPESSETGWQRVSSFLIGFVMVFLAGFAVAYFASGSYSYWWVAAIAAAVIMFPELYDLARSFGKSEMADRVEAPARV